MSVVRGVDVSHHNGAIDWPALAAGLGLTFAFTKATEAEGFTDPRFELNWAGIAAAGLVRGAYHFARPDGDPADDARRFVEVVKGAGRIRSTDLVALDLEVGAPAGVSLHGWAQGWAAEVRRLLPGYSVGLYHSHPVGGFDWWWHARWPGLTGWPVSIPVVPKSGTPDIWQWTDNVQGRRIDGNVYGGTRAQLEALNGGARPNPGPPPVPAPTPGPSVRALTRVLRVTKPRLTGSDVKAVQGAAGMNVADQDGEYGWQTNYHVWRFQRAHRLTADGIVGPQTARAMGFRWAGR